MIAIDRADAYLAIPPGYGADLGGLWWSSNRDAIERGDGTTLALADEIRAVLEGVLARPPGPPFAFVLNLLHLMKSASPGFEPLHEAFVKTRGAVARGRNVGLLIAELCRDLPNDGGAVTAADVIAALRTLRLYGEHTRSDAVAEPPLTRVGFECRVAHRLLSFTDADLLQWLTHGGWPGGGGEQLAEQAESLPARIAKLLAVARRRQRLAGAASLVPLLDAALTLPPRGKPPEALPVGGYCDVTTRGDPERLLPGQFALDPDEFIRRFAASELLYFKREEPHEAVRPERVIVLDQGVRTWGSVRHALTAAAVSLARVDAKRCDRVRLFLTSAPEPIDLTGGDLEFIANQLEASDLTTNPNGALVEALHEPDPALAPRDVILLTHPRSVRDPATYAGGTRRDDDRVFAVSVDESGAAELGEWVRGDFVVLRSFRVDLEAAEAAKAVGEPPRPRTTAPPVGGWTGDAEPVPFPFRPGLIAASHHFGFAADAGWLVIACRDGILHGLALGGNPPEVLPRSFYDGTVLKQVDAILGVTGGVVVCGRMAVRDAPAKPHGATFAPPFTPSEPVAAGGPPPASRSVTLISHEVAVVAAEAPTEQFVAAYYDRYAKRVTLHVLGPASKEPRWAAHLDLHCVTVRTPSGTGCAIDLATQGRFPATGAVNLSLISRAVLAWDRAAKGGRPYDVPIYTTLPPNDSDHWNGPFLHRLNPKAFIMRQSPAACPAIICPQSDGKPVFEGAEVYRAQLAGDVLALAYAKAGERRLMLLRGPEATVLGSVPHPVRANFSLSHDGLFLARRDIARSIVVSQAADPARAIASAGPATLHDALAVELGADPLRLTVVIGGYKHTFRLEGDELTYQSRWELSAPTRGTKGTVPHAPTAYDAARFPPREVADAPGWRAVVDRFGQVLLFRRDEGPLVAAFLVRRERAAAWIPGGVFWGDPRLIGSPPTPDAGRKIGQAILAAEGG